MLDRVILVTADSARALKEALTATNRQAAEYGLPAIACALEGEPRIQYRVDHGSGAGTRWQDKPAGRAEGNIGTRTVQAYRLTWATDSMVMAGGWRFVCVIEDAGLDADNGGRLMLVRGVASDLSAYRTADLSRCDHCGAKRRRHKAVIIRDQDGNVRQVGSTCVDAYLGAGALELINHLDRLVQDFGRLCETFGGDDEGGWGGNGRPVDSWSLDEVGKRAVWLALNRGFVSRAAADVTLGKVATAEEVRNLVTPPNSFTPEAARVAWKADNEAAAACPATAQAYAAALADLEALGKRVVQDDQSLTDWEYNTGIIAARGYVHAKTWGTWVAACALHAVKARDAAAKAAQAASIPAGPSVHFGTVGKRETFALRVLRVHAFDGVYGTTVIVAGVRDGSPDAFVWFASGWDAAQNAGLVEADGCRPVPGAVQVVATVKAHGTNRKTGTPETVLTRVSIPTPPKAKKPRKAKEAATAAPQAQEDAPAPADAYNAGNPAIAVIYCKAASVMQTAAALASTAEANADQDA